MMLQDNTKQKKKKKIRTNLTYKDSFSNDVKYFLNDIDAKTMDKFDFLRTKILDVSSTNLMTICYLEIYHLFQLGIQKLLKMKLF